VNLRKDHYRVSSSRERRTRAKTCRVRLSVEPSVCVTCARVERRRSRPPASRTPCVRRRTGRAASIFFNRKIASNRKRSGDGSAVPRSLRRSVDRSRSSAGTWAATASRERRVSSRLRALGESSAGSPKPPGKAADEKISPAQTDARRETRRARRARSDVRLA